MLSIFFRLLAVLGLMIAIFLAIGSLLPRSYDVSAEMKFAAPAESIFPQIDNLQNWRRWSYFDPASVEQLEIAYFGPPEGEGAIMTWQEPRGTGKLWITTSSPPHYLEYDMQFGQFPTMTSTFQLSAVAEGHTLVTWRSVGRLPPGPFYGWVSWWYAPGLRMQYERSLERLKNLVEDNR